MTEHTLPAGHTLKYATCFKKKTEKKQKQIRLPFFFYKLVAGCIFRCTFTLSENTADTFYVPKLT